MGKHLLFLGFLFSYMASSAQTGTWVSDPDHSRLGFSVKHLSISNVKGRFNDFSVKVTTSKADYSDARIEVVAKVASIDTGIEMRDKHLRSADFFDVEKYPRMTFKSTSHKKTGENTGKLYGDLTFHGITKPVELDVTYNGTVVNPMNGVTTAGFQIKGVVKRSDFDLGPKFSDKAISDEVKIVADIEFNPAK